MIRLGIVSPCYNEEQLLTDSATQLLQELDRLKALGKISEDSILLFVDDGSTDNTWSRIVRLSSENKWCRGIRLAKNVGHQYAIMAGMMYLRDKVDAVITIDADLQDDISAIEKMIDLHRQGNEIVYGVKRNRSVDTPFKRLSARLFYRIQKQCGIEALANHADFRLMSKRALAQLAEYKERNLYLRAIIPSLGLQSSTVEYDLSPRKVGKSKYTLAKMMGLATDGITSFSTRPINFIFLIGVLMLVIALVMFVHVIYSLVTGHFTPGWASIMMSLWFIGAALMFSIGCVGIYIGKIYIEVKNRPLYTIDAETGNVE